MRDDQPVKGILYQAESDQIEGACFAAYNDKGCGFLEPVNQECSEIEFEHLGLPAVPKPKLELQYRGRKLSHGYEPDFICFGKIILEIKAVDKLTDEHQAQLINYLKATGLKLGLLVNFGPYPGLEHERILNVPDRLRRKPPAGFRI